LNKCRHLRVVETLVKFPARLPSLAHLNNRLSDFVYVAYRDVALIDPIRRNILAERAGAREQGVAANLRSPSAVMVEGIVMECFLWSAVADQVALFVSI